VGWAGERLSDYHHTVAQTWQTSVDQLTEAGRHLLERVAFLAPDPVPGLLLDVPVPGVTTEDAHAALDDLATYSLAVSDTQGGSFTVHPLVQDVTRRRLEAGSMANKRLTEALGWVNAAFAGDPQDWRTWVQLDPLAPHADTVTRHADAAGIAAPTLRLMSSLGLLFHAKMVNAQAELLLRRALAIGEASLGNDHPDIADCLNNLAGHLAETNRLPEAEPLIRRALGISQASFGDQHPNVARALNNLARLLQATSRPDEAEPLIRRALAIIETSLGRIHPSVAPLLTTLAELLKNTNRPGEAEPLLRRALDVGEACLGKDHPIVAKRLNNLAVLLKDMNRPDEAEPLYRRALAIDEATLGENHPDVARDLNNIATLPQATNRPAEAEPLLRRALAICEASFGEQHPSVAIALNNLARLLQTTNRPDEAEPLMRRHLAIFLAFQRDTGHAHPLCDKAIHNYTDLLRAMGRSEAEIEAGLTTLRREVGLQRD
jgi:tetratricopeptide (TPR) repeat protein